MRDVTNMSALLEEAIKAWKVVLDDEMEDLITPGVVASAINDIRFEAGCLPAMELPQQLYTLFLDASSRITKGRRDEREFNVKVLRRTVINTIASMDALAPKA
jgi:hypothetical protein